MDPSGHAEIIPNREGQATTPSVVFFDNGSVVVGHEAVRAALLEPEKSAECFKRDMGRSHYNKKVCGKYMRPEALSALVLKKLKRDAEEKIGPIAEAVITVPAYFDDARRKATQDAGGIAGLNVVDIINEPTAAAIWYGYGKHQATEGDTVFLVYDLGGGTFDATLMRASGASEFKTVATDGEVMLGGKDWDKRLLDYVAGEFMRKAGADPREDDLSFQELSVRVEESKRSLSTRNSVSVPVSHAGQRLAVPVDRAKFRDLTADLLARTQTTVELLIAEAGFAWPQVNHVLLVGGSSRMPMVTDMISRVTGKDPDASLDADLDVAKGAAVHGGSLRVKKDPAGGGFDRAAAETLKVLKHKNVNSHSLGVVARSRKADGGSRNFIVITKNTELPCEKSKTFGTAVENQRIVKVTVLEGEAPDPKACVEIGTCSIEGLPAGLPKASPVEVTFSYTDEGRIHVSAVAKAVGRSASVRVSRPEGLDGDGMERETNAVAKLEVI